MPEVTITVTGRPDGGRLVAPAAMTTPQWDVADLDLFETGITRHEEARTGQTLCVMACAPGKGAVMRYSYRPGTGYPDSLFVPGNSRFTRTADAMAEEARCLAKGPDPVQALAQHVAGLFSYGHPERRFHDGLDHIPRICGQTEGSCMDINAYFIAALRAAGIEAGYVTGYFFPAEKSDANGHAWCNDMHCWAVTRCEHGLREWDIAHHMKAGLATIAPALNPKPGWRVPVAHSMGLCFPTLGLEDIKLISEPMWLGEGGLERATLRIEGRA